MTSDEFVDKQEATLKDVHPVLANVLANQAHDRGHSSGYDEVLNILQSLVDDFKQINDLLRYGSYR